MSRDVTAPPPILRRGFLRALAGLPLIGGNIALIGEPVAAATPISLDLLRRYAIFLGRELQAARIEMELIRSPRYFADRGLSLNDPETWRSEAWWMEIPKEPAVEALITSRPASTRAAVVLSAAGVHV